MQTVTTQPASPPSQPDYLAIAQLIMSGLGLVFALFTAGLLLVVGFAGFFAESMRTSDITGMFAMAWIGLLVAALAVPSLLLSIQHLSGRSLFAWAAHLRVQGLRLSSILLLLWPFVLLLGNFISGQSQLAWLLLPPLDLLAVGIPVWWLVELALNKLEVGGLRRGWGLIDFSIFITTPLLMILEILVLIGLVLVFAIWLGTHPALVSELQRLGQNLAGLQNNPEAILRLVQPYLQNPLLIYGSLAIIAGIIPMLEELFKPLGVWLLAGRRLTPAEGFAAGALCGGAFALIESLFYLSSPMSGGWAALAAGRAGTEMLHITTSAVVGWGLASAWQSGAYLRLGLAYLLAVTLHGLWNALSVLTELSAVMQSAPVNLNLVNGIAKVAPYTILAIAILVFGILLGSNRSLRRTDATANSVSIYPDESSQ